MDAITLNNSQKPHIVVGKMQHQKLTSLAYHASERNAAVADELLNELERASLVADENLPDDVAALGSSIEYETETGQVKSVTLCFPGKADISKGLVSIMTPIGVALLGLKPGQSIDWTARDGHVHRLLIKSVAKAG